MRVRVRVRVGSAPEITPEIDAEITPEIDAEIAPETAPEIGAPESSSGVGDDVPESGEGDDAPDTVVSWRSGDKFGGRVGLRVRVWVLVRVMVGSAPEIERMPDLGPQIASDSPGGT